MDLLKGTSRVQRLTNSLSSEGCFFPLPHPDPKLPVAMEWPGSALIGAVLPAAPVAPASLTLEEAG